MAESVFTPTLKLPNPKRGDAPTVPADFRSLTDRIEEIGMRPKVGSDEERAATYPDPQQGDEVFHRGRGHAERYYDERSAANPGGATPAGWHQIDYIDSQVGRLLDTIEIPFSGGGFRFPDRFKLLVDHKIEAPRGGTAYRIAVAGTAELFVEGGPRAGVSRYDLVAGVGGDYGSAVYDYIGGTISQGNNIMQQFTTLPSARVFRGDTRVLLGARRLDFVNAPDGAWGELTQYNRGFVVSIFSA